MPLSDAAFWLSFAMRDRRNVRRLTSDDVEFRGLPCGVPPVPLVDFQNPAGIAIGSAAAFRKERAAGRVFENATASADLFHGPRAERMFIRRRFGCHRSEVPPGPAWRVRDHRTIASEVSGIAANIPAIHASQHFVGADLAAKEHRNGPTSRSRKSLASGC